MNFTLTVSTDEAQTIMDALGEQPYAKVVVLYQKLAMQLSQQQQRAAARTSDAAVPISGEVGG